MKITQWEFENEFESLLNAAQSTDNKETARRFLIQAENKIGGYDDIPWSSKQEYVRRVDEVRRELGI
jgi:hypothetical protein